MMVDVCTDGLVMMVIRKMILTKYAGSNFFGKHPLQALSGIGGVCLDG